MPKISLLPKNVSELIAAGEVVERPASVVKELIENSVDSGATAITVEIQNGGIKYMRVTDNGCGIDYSDVPTAFLRHATSKIKIEDDLNSITTLGFRGEALAAIASVSKIEMLTATKNSDFGTRYVIEGGLQAEYTEAGCPKGTTIIIRDIFYNTPARMKFLKKDISESNSCAAIIDRIALSHPEISFKFIRDGKQVLSTLGDGNLMGTVYSVLGREFSNSLINVDSTVDDITVRGLTCKPVSCKATRNSQFTFLNGRFVRSGTVVAAVEQAYKNSAMIGKFPGFILYLSLPFDTVDVNVHPSKTEVRFSNEHLIFEAVYKAIKAAINQGDTRPEIKLNKPIFNPFEHITTQEYKQHKLGIEETIAEKIYKEDLISLNTNAKVSPSNAKTQLSGKEFFYSKNVQNFSPVLKKDYSNLTTFNQGRPELNFETTVVEGYETPQINIVGEVFSTYIIAQMNDSIFIIDKHAAHERIIYNNLRNERKIEIQQLLIPVTAVISAEEYDTIINNIELLLKSGFEVEDLGNSAVTVRAVPSFLVDLDIPSVISEIADSIINSGVVEVEKEDNLYHTVACKAAIKAGQFTTIKEMQNLAEKVLTSKDIMYCPHGRPVAYEIKKRQLEKQFGRIQ